LSAALARLKTVSAAEANAHPDKYIGPKILTELAAKADGVTRHARDVFYPPIGPKSPPQAYVMHYFAGSASGGWQKRRNPAGEQAFVDSQLARALNSGQ